MLTRIIVSIDLLKRDIPRERIFEQNDIRFILTEYPIGWDLETATRLIRQHTGYVDAFALSGAREHVGTQSRRFKPAPIARLFRSAGETPIFTADSLREIFSQWAFHQMIKPHREHFQGRNTLFHMATANPLLDPFDEIGAKIHATDAMILTRVPVLLSGRSAIDRFFTLSSFVQIGLSLKSLERTITHEPTKVGYLDSTLHDWIAKNEVFVTTMSRLDSLLDLSCLADKILVVDYLRPGFREKLESVGIAEIIEYFPHHPILNRFKELHPALAAAILDLIRQHEDPQASFQDFILEKLIKINVAHSPPARLKSSAIRVGFVVHPLSTDLLWKATGLGFVGQFPRRVQASLEGLAAHAPPFHYGTISGIRSTATKQEVICELYGITATPRQLLRMDEHDAYKIIGKAVDLARKDGAALVGLGAYTKVIGDAGVTIAKLADVPVTNGNSYSASATLWAANDAARRLGFIRQHPDRPQADASAMVIGATGSIGRVSALLMARAFKELILIAPRPEKLLEMLSELKTFAPDCNIKLATDPNRYLASCDLIVTATSKPGGSVFDIEQIKPGAVVCDCSRPLNVTRADALKRPDVLIIESGEIDLPGEVKIPVELGLPKPSVYACLAETCVLAMEGRFENFSLSKALSWERTKEIYRLGLKHGARLSAIRGPLGWITDDDIRKCREAALQKLKSQA